MKKVMVLLLCALAMVFALSGMALASDYELDELTVEDTRDVEIDGYYLFSAFSRNATKIDIAAAVDEDTEDAVIKMETSVGSLSEVKNGEATLTMPTGKDCAIVTITVEDGEGDEQETYHLALIRSKSAVDPDSQALLEGLRITTAIKNGDTLLKAADFDPGKTEYEIYVDEDNEYEDVYLWLTPFGDEVDIYVDGERVKSSKYSGYEIELNYEGKEQEVEIEVVYDEDEDLSTTYTITFTYEETVKTNASLDDLLVSRKAADTESKLYGVYPKFDGKQLDYYAFLPEGDDSAYVLLAPEDEDYYIEYDNIELLDETGDYYYTKLTGIKNGASYDFKVYDDDDELLDTYTVTFYLGDDGDNDEAELGDLSLRYKTGANSYDKVSLDKKFDAGAKSYSASVTANSYGKIRVYAEADDKDAYVLVNGKLANEDGYVDLDVTKGKNTVTVLVIAENCDDSETYTLTVNYGSAPVATTALAALEVRNSLGAVLNLSPAFSAEGKAYTASVDNTVSALSLKATAGSEGANIYYGSTKLESGVYSSYISLSEGINNLTLTVSGEGASSTVYYLTIYRQPARIKAVVSSQGLTVNGQSKKLYAYNINGNNFIKLRDLASALNGTAKQFAVEFSQGSNAVYLTSNSPYVSNGQENVKLGQPGRAVATSQLVYKDSVGVNPMAYNIDGNNYVMLRDIGLLFNFGVSYNSSTGTIAIDTASSYSPLS